MQFHFCSLPSRIDGWDLAAELYCDPEPQTDLYSCFYEWPVSNPFMPDDDLDRPNGLEGDGQIQKTEPPPRTQIQETIGQGLRAMYASLKAEPIPDHILELLGKLDTPKQDGDQ
jgi:hypothetical protein